MRKLLILISLLLCSPALAQVPMTGAGKGTPATASCSPGTAATNFLARTSGLNGTETTAYCNMINGLVSDGIITGTLSGAAGCGSVLDGLYILATNNTTTAALNLCGTSFSLVSHGTPTFTADVGYTGDGSSAFLDTQWVPNTNGVNYTQNSASIGVYIQTNGSGTSNTDVMGAAASGLTFTRFQPKNSSNLLFGVNVATSFATAANANVQGAWVLSRTASTTTTVYQNGATTFTTAATASTTRTTFSLYLLALNTSGSATNFSPYQISSAFMGAGLTSTQAFAINNRINAFMLALGHNIY